MYMRVKYETKEENLQMKIKNPFISVLKNVKM